MFYIDNNNVIHYENSSNSTNDTGSSRYLNPTPGKYTIMSLLLFLTFIAISIGICFAVAKVTRNICLGFLCFIPCLIILGIIWFFLLKNV